MHSKDTQKAIAMEIKRQLGRSFGIMTGATDFVYGEGEEGVFLRFRIKARAKKAIKWVTITLNANDTYHVAFTKIKRKTMEVITVSEQSDVYNTDLRGVFTAHTDLLTSFNG